MEIKKANGALNRQLKMRKYNILSILCVIIVILSWFLNMGWLRFLLTIPILIHIVIFFISNGLYNRYVNKTPRYLLLINIFNYGTFLCGYVFLPDFGDVEEASRAMFGLVKNKSFIDIAFDVSLSILFINIILIMVQIIFTFIYKKKP